MNTPGDVAALERALLARAEALAAEYVERARRSRDRILAEKNEHLRLREERAMLAAKAVADRTYRRLVQQAELAFQEELDRLRWQILRDTLDALSERLVQVTQDKGIQDEGYFVLLERFLASAARSIGQDDLVCEVNATDLPPLQEIWKDFARSAAPNQRITLHEVPRTCTGGLLLRTADDRVRVDNTFEGRLARLEEAMERIIQERLFPAHLGASCNG